MAKKFHTRYEIQVFTDSSSVLLHLLLKTLILLTTAPINLKLLHVNRFSSDLGHRHIIIISVNPFKKINDDYQS